MKDFIIAHMIEPVEKGGRFTQWPLHVTLLPWFQASSSESVAARLREIATDTAPIDTHITGREYFGVQRNLPVMLLENITELQELHEKLLAMVEAQDWQLEGRYTGEHYRPHITQKAGRDADEKVTIDELYLVTSLPMGYREVVEKIGLADD